jgi:SAM-dependent methyltransferase
MAGLRAWMDRHGVLTGVRRTLAKQRYWSTTKRRLMNNEWSGEYWYEQDGVRIVPCRRCPKFDAQNEICRVPFGTPLRKCVVAATEAHLRGTHGLNALELGYGARSFAKHVIVASGGSWTGVEPGLPGEGPRQIGTGGHGHAGDIPFPDETFDVAFGNQSFEHWEDGHHLQTDRPSYRECLAEVWRVLKPGGTVYLDAPIHLHGHEMFIVGDVARVLGLFDPALWRDLVAEKWRYDHAPLPPYPTPARDRAGWPGAIKSYGADVVDEARRLGTVWLLTVTARKRGTARAKESAPALSR